MKKTIVILLTFCCMLSCTSPSKNSNQIVLLLDTTNSTVKDDLFPLDKIVITYGDSIIFDRFVGDKPFESIFFKQNGNIYETRQRGTFIDELNDIDTILTLSLKDTSFIYKADYFPVFVYLLAKYDCKYTIHQGEGDSRITTKQSLLDTTFKEIFYYDKDFRIYKFINTYKENKCVYVDIVKE